MIGPAHGDDGLAVSLRLVDDVRARGLTVSATQAALLVQALAAAPDASLRHVARITLARGPDELTMIDEVIGPQPSDSDRKSENRAVADDLAEGGGGDGTADRGQTRGRRTASTTEILRARDLGSCRDDERAEIEHMLARLPMVGDRYLSRRSARAFGRGRPDVRSIVRRSVRSDGELLHLVRRRRAVRTRRVVLLLDVSGSMEDYARAMLLLAHVGAAGAGNVEVFALGTRLTRLTRVLACRNPDVALRDAGLATEDWGGGTRLGDTLRSLIDDPGCRGLLRGATVVMLSDGLDRGDPEQLRAQVERISRLAHRMIWVNPLRASEGYQPLAAGMRAALAHVDHFVDGHSVEALDELVQLVANPQAPV